MTVDHVFTIEWWEDITERVDCTTPGARGSYRRVIGKRKMRGKVHVSIPVDQIAQTMGRAAHCNKSGKSVDGFITVKRAGQAEELTREMKPVPDGATV